MPDSQIEVLGQTYRLDPKFKFPLYYPDPDPSIADWPHLIWDERSGQWRTSFDYCNSLIYPSPEEVVLAFWTFSAQKSLPQLAKLVPWNGIEQVAGHPYYRYRSLLVSVDDCSTEPLLYCLKGRWRAYGRYRDRLIGASGSSAWRVYHAYCRVVALANLEALQEHYTLFLQATALSRGGQDAFHGGVHHHLRLVRTHHQSYRQADSKALAAESYCQLKLVGV